MSSEDGERRQPPHIRLNSGQHDPFGDQSAVAGSMRSPSIRSLAASQSPSAGSGQAPHAVYGPAISTGPLSSELLIPPRTLRPHSLSRDDQSALSSRRTSWSSDTGSRYEIWDDSRAPSRTESEEENVNTQTVSEKYNILPNDGLLIFPEDVEYDDYLHNPDPNDTDRPNCKDMLSKRGAANLGGLLLVVGGVMFLFIAWPVMTFVQQYTAKTSICDGIPMCLDVGDVPLLKNVRTGLIDPDTPDDVKHITSADGKKWSLVFSDEFNTDGRTFYDGDDAYFQAVDVWYGVTQDLEWYDPDAATTKDGVLELRFDAFQNHGVNYRSAMMQSWNKLCFQGGRLEASVSLPGRGDTVGFWPGFWAIGNLGRPGYAATTDGMWPYSYADICDPGITANQSSTDGISYLPGMRLPACTCPGEDHPSPGRSRSVPEIDVFEASSLMLDSEGNMVGDVSQSLQIAPFDIWYTPNPDFYELYDPRITRINSYKGGPYQQAMSGLTLLNNKWYDGQEYQKYAFEYSMGAEGAITWFVGDQKTWKADARSIGPNGNIGQRVIPVEPMAIVINFGISPSFSSLNLSAIGDLLPATMRVDYVRIYQDPSNSSVTCDPPGHETTEYINKHKKAYTNANLTMWADAEYDWPKNSFVHGCSSG